MAEFDWMKVHWIIPNILYVLPSTCIVMMMMPLQPLVEIKMPMSSWDNCELTEQLFSSYDVENLELNEI